MLIPEALPAVPASPSKANTAHSADGTELGGRRSMRFRFYALLRTRSLLLTAAVAIAETAKRVVPRGGSPQRFQKASS